MIKDESHDIRMALIKTLVQLHEVVNIDSFVNGIIPSLIEISNNPNWRIRNQISETIPVLARILNKKIFMDSILSTCTKWLTDPVYAIRESACKLMKKLYDMFKGEEFEKKLLDKLNEMKSSDSYLIRNTVTILVKEFVGDVYRIILTPKITKKNEARDFVKKQADFDKYDDDDFDPNDIFANF